MITRFVYLLYICLSFTFASTLLFYKGLPVYLLLYRPICLPIYLAIKFLQFHFFTCFLSVYLFTDPPVYLFCRDQFAYVLSCLPVLYRSMCLLICTATQFFQVYLFTSILQAYMFTCFVAVDLLTYISSYQIFPGLSVYLFSAGLSVYLLPASLMVYLFSIRLVCFSTYLLISSL